MWTKEFWKDAAERAIKTFAQAMVSVFLFFNISGIESVGNSVSGIDWMYALAFSGLAALISLLTSIGGIAVGPRGTPSVVTEPVKPPQLP